MTKNKNLNDFIGKWKLSREIRHDDGVVDRFDGFANFTADGDDRIRYDEEGTLHALGTSFQATRRNFWRLDGQGVTVEFDDGRFFHHFDWHTPEAMHPCGADDYRVRYDFHGDDAWQAQWRVRGPNKGYLMISDYTRA